MTIQTIKRNISKLLIVVLAAMLMIAFIPGDVQAGLENLANAGLTPDSWEDTIFDVDTKLVDQMPSWEEFSAPGNQYGYEAQLYVTLTDYIDNFTNTTYKGTHTVDNGDGTTYEVYDYIVRIDNAMELYLFSQVTNPTTTVSQLAAAAGGLPYESIMREFLDLHYVLGNNIDWKDVPGYKFNPIGKGADTSITGSYDRPFTGTFDGQGFEITNLEFITDSAGLADDVYFGFFGCVGETGFVTMFGLYDPIIDTGVQTGNMCVAGIAGKNYGRIEYVYVASVNVTGYSVAAPVGVAGVVYHNYENAILKNAYYTGSVVTPGSSMGVAVAYPVYYSNKSEDVGELYYNRDKFMPANNLPALVTAAGYPKNANNDDYTLFREAFNAFEPVTNHSIGTINGYINGTTVIPAGANGLDKFCAFFGVNVNELYNPPAHLHDLIKAFDSSNYTVVSYDKFREAFNEFLPQTWGVGIATINAYINGTTPIPSTGEPGSATDLRGKFCAFLGLTDEELDDPVVLSNAIKALGYDVVSYANLWNLYKAHAPASNPTQGVFEGYINGSLPMPDDVKTKLCDFLGVAWSAINTPAKLQAVIEQASYTYWPQYTGFLRYLNATGPLTFGQSALDQWINGTLAISIGAPGSTTDYLGQLCNVLGVQYGDVYQNRNLNEPGEVTPMRDDDLRCRRYGLTDDKWRRHDYRLVYSTHTYDQFELSTYPKLSGFAGDLNPDTLLPASINVWGQNTLRDGYTHPLTILTPADLVYFAKFISAGNNYRLGLDNTTTAQTFIRDRTFYLGACVDMSSVAPDAYKFTYGTLYPDDFRLPFTGTFYGLAKGTEACLTGHDDCEGYHIETITEEALKASNDLTPIATAPSHNILNLTMIEEVFTSGITISANIPYIPQNSYALGFLPFVGGGTMENVNFIGGLCSPSHYNENTGSTSLYHVGSVQGIHTSGSFRNIHSSMPVIIPDGEGLPFVAGGLMGSTRSAFQYCSYSGFVSGGIHPYNATYAPDSNPSAITAAEQRALYYTAGLVGLAQYAGGTEVSSPNFSAIQNILGYCINTAKIEGAGFYGLSGDESFAEFGIGVAGLVGENTEKTTPYVSVSPPKYSINYGDVYATPMHYVNGDAATPRTGPEGVPVYAISPVVGGIQSHGAQPGYIYGWDANRAPYLVPGMASLNYGSVNIDNAVGTTWAAGIVAAAKYAHYNPADRFINFGDITINNAAGALRVAGIYNKSDSYSTQTNRYLQNYGNITVIAPNATECVVAGISNGRSTEQPTRYTLNYGNITVDVGDNCTTTRVSGVVSRYSTISGVQLFVGVHNYGDITVTSAQATGELWVQGISSGYSTTVSGTTSDNGGVFNSGDITVNATAVDAATNIGVSGIFGYFNIARNIDNAMNQGNITVNADTSTPLYVGGITSNNPSGARLQSCLNGGAITVTNTGSGDVYVGGLAGYWNELIMDGVNNGDITATSSGQNAYVAGIAGLSRTNNYTRINNCLNYGDVTSSNNNPDANTLYTAGISGIYYVAGNNGSYRNSGLVNYGNISETHHASANTDSIMVSGIVSYLRICANNSRVTGFVNYGTITGTTPWRAAIFTRGVFGNITTGVAGNHNGVVFANMVNTDEQTDMFKETDTTFVTHVNYLHYVTLMNLYTTNQNDPNITGSRDTKHLFAGSVQYAQADDTPGGIYHEDNGLRQDPAGNYNNSLVYVEPMYVAPHLLTAHPYGIYALVTQEITANTVDSLFPFSLNVLDNLYLPDSMRLTGPFSMAPETHLTADYVAVFDEAEMNFYNDWVSQSRADGGDSAKTLYDNSKQVLIELNIIAMSMQADTSTEYEMRPILSEIQSRGPAERTINYYYTEDLLGRTMKIRDFKLSDPTAELRANEDGDPWQGVVFELAESYDPEVDTDLDTLTRSATVWVFSGGEKIPFTINYYFLPEPKVTLRLINRSQEGIYPFKNSTNPGYANENRSNMQLYSPINYTEDDLVIESDGTYVIQAPVYRYAWGTTYGFFAISLQAENLTEQFYMADYTKVYNDDGEDVTNRFSVYRNSSGAFTPYAWSMKYSARDGKYYSGSNKTATAPAQIGTFRIESNGNNANAYIEPGWYTMVTTVNGRDLIRVKFQFVDHTLGRASVAFADSYTEDIDSLTYTRTNALFGRADYAWSLRVPDSSTEGPIQSAWDAYLGNLENDRYYYSYQLTENGTTKTHYEYCGKYLYDVVTNPDGSHEYKVKLGIWPNYAYTDWQYEPVTWWDVVTYEAPPETVVSTYSGLQLNDAQVTGGDGTLVKVSGDNQNNKINVSGSFDNADFYATAGSKVLTFDVTYNGEPLTLKAGSSKPSNLIYQYNGVDVLKCSYTIASTSSSGNTASGRADYQFDLYAAAQGGTYAVQPIYDRYYDTLVYDIDVADFDTMSRDAIKTLVEATAQTKRVEWHSPVGTAFTISKAESSDSYLRAMQFPGMVMGELMCTRTDHSHAVNPITLGRNNEINYTKSTTMTGDNRCDYFTFRLYLEDGFDLTSYTPSFMARESHATLYIFDKALNDWREIGFAHTADYTITDPINGSIIRYKVVAQDGETVTYYDVHVSGLPRNKTFNITAVGEGALAGKNLQKHLTDSGMDLLATVRVWNGVKAIEATAGCFIGDNGTILPYEFAKMMSGNYLLDASVPDDCYYYIKFQSVTYTEGVDGAEGVLFNVGEPQVTRDINIQIVVGLKDNYTPPAAQPMRLQWRSDNTDTINPAPHNTVVFTTSVKLIPTMDYGQFDYAISPRWMLGNFNHYIYFKSDIIIEAGVTVEGNLYTTGNIINHGTVDGNLFAEGTVSGTGTTINGGIYDGYWS